MPTESLVFKNDLNELGIFERLLLNICPIATFNRLDLNGNMIMELCRVYKGNAYRVGRTVLPPEYDYQAIGSLIQPNTFSCSGEITPSFFKIILRKLFGIDSAEEVFEKYIRTP